MEEDQEPQADPSGNPPPAIQFETVEGERPQGVSCAQCQTGLTTEYHELNGHPVCAICRAKAEVEHQKDRAWSQFLVAAVYGFGAAIVGGLLYWGFVKITNIELGLMAIAVGWLVGKAVMKGSNARGGRRYQWLAVALAYFSITISYGALIIEAMIKAPPPTQEAAGGSSKSSGSAKKGVVEQQPADQTAPPVTAGTAVLGIGFLFLIVLASPFLVGFSNIMGWIIIAIGLWEAWKHTAERPFVTGGPYPIGQRAAPSA